MKLDFSKHILDLDDKPMKGISEETPLTLGVVAVGALLANFDDERNLGTVEKTRRFQLALRIDKGGEQDVDVKDADLIKTLIGKAYTTLVVGRACELIEGTSVTTD